MSGDEVVQMYLERLAARLSLEDFRQVVGRLSDADLRRHAQNEMEAEAIFLQSQQEGKTEEERRAIFARLIKERQAKYDAARAKE